MHSPTRVEVQAVQSVARFEGGYGHNWTAPGIGSNNWGAVQCLRSAPCPEGCFQSTDSDDRGANFQACFRIYETAVEGAADLVMELYRRDQVPEALRTGDTRAIAHRMKAAGYFTAPVEAYARAMEMNAKDLAEALGEPHLVYRGIRKEDPKELSKRIAPPPPPAAVTPTPPPLPKPVADDQEPAKAIHADPTRVETEGPRAVLLMLGLLIGGVLALRTRRTRRVRRA
jgi:hypothetical protein